MNGEFKICSYCARGYSHLLDACPHCGSSKIADYQGNPFWSSPYTRDRTVLDIPPDTQLLDRRFTVKTLLGRGRWASVFLAQDRIRKMDVALKIVVLGPGNPEDALGAFRNEVTLHTSLTDLSHVVHLFDVHVIPWGGVSLLLLPMEYAEGGSLRDWIQSKQKDCETRRQNGVNLFLQACQGYRAIHQAGAVHLDTKPENLLLVGGVVKVSDLGAAYMRKRDGNDPAFSPFMPQLELGTPIYMSPEQFQIAHPEDLDHRSDIYSLGVVLYEMISRGGRPPFLGSPERVRDCHLNVQPAPLKNIEPHLKEAVARCLAKDPEERFGSVDELIEALREQPQSPPIREEDQEQRLYSSVDEKYQKAASCYQEGDLSRATSLVEEVLAEQPDHVRAHQLSRKLQERYRLAEQLYAEASLLLEKGEMAPGVDLIQEATEVYPEHPSAVPVLSKASFHSRRFAECMTEATTALKNGAWDNAASLFEEALRLNRQVPNVVEVLNQVNRIRQAKTEMHAALFRAEFDRADQLAGLADSLAKDLLESIHLPCE